MKPGLFSRSHCLHQGARQAPFPGCELGTNHFLSGVSGVKRKGCACMSLRICLEGRPPQPQDFFIKGPRSSSPRRTFPRGKSAPLPPRKKMAESDVTVGAGTGSRRWRAVPFPPRLAIADADRRFCACARGAGWARLRTARQRGRARWPGAEPPTAVCGLSLGIPAGQEGSGVLPAAIESSSAAAGEETKAGRGMSRRPRCGR